MKKIFIAFISLATLMQLSCTKEHLDQTNTDPTKASAGTFDPNYLLSNTQFNFANTGYAQLLYEAMMTQGMASTLNYYGNGDKYVNAGSFNDYQKRIWNDGYNAVSGVREMQLLANQKGAASYSNLIAIGDICFVLYMERITDTYGDVPYSQAAQAKAGITTPVYDSQSSIYPSMLSTLESAIGKLDASKDKPTSDLFYNGDITKWKKFGYSLMLRIAMRMTKIDLATAKTWAEKASTGGTFESIADNALVATDATNSALFNSNANDLLTATDYVEVKWGKTFIDMLKANADPRISYISEVPQAGLANGADNTTVKPGNTAATAQLGLPNGYDLLGGATDIRKRSDYPGSTGTGSDTYITGKYSRPVTSVYLNRNNPNFVFTYAETEFLLAEAKVRGFNVTGTAAQHYANGITGSLQSLAQMNSGATIPAATIATYATAHVLDVTSTENSIKDINNQYWISTVSTFSFMENWFNWKRTGYPVLTPVVYTGNVTNGTIPRRMPYPTDEPLKNPTNYNAAVAKLPAGNTLTGRTWWDK
ncbi:SusD/RagB family nutrient-binding outer membrane lipoprotein [Mucilaginibacter sp. CAU 1740]|uniref:SusD/RagB family nutrient-binding outer membrane lipoprotein n=1 Tax=Mucilaginibacter sp. CAU 1740 TaxID=3140365 RepID=UPI00325BF20D